MVGFGPAMIVTLVVIADLPSASLARSPVELVVRELRWSIRDLGD